MGKKHLFRALKNSYDEKGCAVAMKEAKRARQCFRVAEEESYAAAMKEAAYCACDPDAENALCLLCYMIIFFSSVLLIYLVPMYAAAMKQADLAYECFRVVEDKCYAAALKKVAMKKAADRDRKPNAENGPSLLYAAAMKQADLAYECFRVVEDKCYAAALKKVAMKKAADRDRKPNAENGPSLLCGMILFFGSLFLIFGR
ncbi:uncharacterized protein HKW66_Vig0131750 [Vigna angularis]|uniref:Uncharacterized protein n=1 Tax=Phaseolus angularis TaxID=3914 RepID=A0A8T0K1U0_PHAAN|nr:uncharacterized protein HKW66_Vig0131750 [Vigna angularis]